ncbi:MAG: hypothetical protein IT176_01005 [Acidobacteria bacterium]|nr:hypothetical protein [Acidobacteriota bacterium]
MAESRGPLILVVAPGSNPRTVTDALTAIVAREGRGVDEVHVLAAAGSGDRLRVRLLHPPSGRDVVAAACVELGLTRTDITFSARTIHVLGKPNDATAIGAVADDLLATLRRLCTESNELRIVASAAAGPVAVLASAALQLVGRPDDRFFFLQGQPFVGRNKHDRKPALLEIATVLAEQPPASYETYQAIASARRVARRRLIEPDDLVIDLPRRVMRVGETELLFPRLQFFWLFALATLAPCAFHLKRLTGSFHVDDRGAIVVAADAADHAALESLVAHTRFAFAALFPDSIEEFPLMFKRACGPSPGLPSIVAKINARIRRALGVGAEPYLISAHGGEGYRLLLAPTAIKIEGLHERVLPRGQRA